MQPYEFFKKSGTQRSHFSALLFLIKIACIAGINSPLFCFFIVSFFVHQNVISYNSATTSYSQAIVFALLFSISALLSRQSWLIDFGLKYCFWVSQLPRIIHISFTKRSIWGPLVPYGSDGRSCKSFPTASNPLQILYKTDHSGASGASWLGMAIRQILSKRFKSFTNPLQN